MNAVAPASAHALQLLFARFLAGQIADAQFAGLSNLLDDADASADERTAFARFTLDTMGLPDGAELPLPTAEEMADLLAIARA